MDRRRFIRLAAGSDVASVGGAGAGCSQQMPADAIAAWKGPGTGTDARRWILGYAILAPHSHNLQSWLVDLRAPGEIVLRCHLARLLPETDPFSRQIMMSHGTFVELLDIAARERGLRTGISLFPEGPFGASTLDQRPVARIRLAADPTISKDPLFAQILHRHTNRSAYRTDHPVPADAWHAMRESVRPNALRFGFVGTDQPDALKSHRVGLFDRSKPPDPNDYATTSQINDFNVKLESTPGFLWMVTDGKDRVTQVNAGRAYARVQLTATAAGIALQPLQQALQEYPAQATPYAGVRRLLDASSPSQTIQMWARAGFAPPVGPAPRRGVDAQLVRA